MSIVETPTTRTWLSAKRLGYVFAVVGPAAAWTAWRTGSPIAQVLAVVALASYSVVLSVFILTPANFLLKLPQTERPVVHGLFLVPTLILVWETAHSDVLHMGALWLITLAAAVLGVLAALWTPRPPPAPGRFWFFIVAALLAAGLTEGGALLVNRVFDVAKSGETYRVEVVGKQRRGMRTGPWVDIAPFGPAREATSHEVDQATFDALTVGGTMCVTLHPGALDVPWYSYRVC